jgi:hypothetical protein
MKTAARPAMETHWAQRCAQLLKRSGIDPVATFT